jgi:hypothetical protein
VPLLLYCYLFFYAFTETTQIDRHSLFYILYCATSVCIFKRTEFERNVRYRALLLFVSDTGENPVSLLPAGDAELLPAVT